MNEIVQIPETEIRMSLQQVLNRLKKMERILNNMDDTIEKLKNLLENRPV